MNYLSLNHVSYHVLDRKLIIIYLELRLVLNTLSQAGHSSISSASKGIIHTTKNLIFYFNSASDKNCIFNEVNHK